MLELGKSGAAGYPHGELPVVRDGKVVAVLRASNWKEAATAEVGAAFPLVSRYPRMRV